MHNQSVSMTAPGVMLWDASTEVETGRASWNTEANGNLQDKRLSAQKMCGVWRGSDKNKAAALED